jgi:hypothetical protein
VDLASGRDTVPQGDQVLDIFHAAQHIASAASALYGEGTIAAADWTTGPASTEGKAAGGQADVDELIGYFAKHTDRLDSFCATNTGHGRKIATAVLSHHITRIFSERVEQEGSNSW